MADVRPLRGVRFDRRYSGPVGPLLAPPYDVVDPLRRFNDFGIGLIEQVRLGAVSDQHALSAARYRNWRMRGILRRDAGPAIYLHRHSFDHDGSETVRTGLVVRVRLTDWSDRIVLPHERTTAGPRVERLQRLRAVEANLSPLYLLFRDPNGDLRELLSADGARDMPFNEEDRRGGHHQLMALASPVLHRRFAELLRERTLFVADGHHRYEAALAYRDERRRCFGSNHDDDSEFVMALLAAAEDEGVRIRPIHRLIEAGKGLNVTRLMKQLRRWFIVRPAVGDLDQWRDDVFMFRVLLPQNFGSWDVLRWPGNPHLSLMPVDKGAAWRSLPISALQAILQQAFDDASGDETPEVGLTLDATDANRSVASGVATAAFLLPAPRLDQVLEVAEEGDLMPAKSTWFEPKAPAGLVINELGRRIPNK